MAQAALNARNTAAATLKSSIRTLQRYIDGDNPSKRLLQNKLEKTADDKENLLSKHFTYAEKANIDLETDQDMLQWINTRVDEADEIMDRATIKIEELDLVIDNQQKTLDKALSETRVTNEIHVKELQCTTNENALNIEGDWD